MLTVSAMGIFVLGLKAGTAILATFGVVSGVHWFNTKKIATKKGGSRHESEFDSEKFDRHNI